jgi:hypothetical protein
MISSWDYRKLWLRRRIEASIRNALKAATALEETVDVVHLAARISEGMVGASHKAKMLSGIARILAEHDRMPEAVQVLVAALDASKLAGRDSVMEVLADGAATLATIDEGELLCAIDQTLVDVESWFERQSARALDQETIDH